MSEKQYEMALHLKMDELMQLNESLLDAGVICRITRLDAIKGALVAYATQRGRSSAQNRQPVCLWIVNS